MYLRTPKRYSAKGKRRFLVSWRWLWLYMLAPLIIIPAALAWQNRATLSQSVSQWAEQNIRVELNPPTPTPTVPAADLEIQLSNFLQSGNLRSAISTLDSLTDATPNDVGAYTLLTRMVLFRGDPEDPKRLESALKAASGALNADPEAPDGWIMMAMALNAAERPREALPYLLHARDLDNENPLMLAVMAETYDNLDLPDRASTLVDQAIEAAKAANPLDPSTLAYAHVVQGTILARTSGEEAIRAYEEAWRVAQTEPIMPVGYIAQWLWAYYFNTPDLMRLVDILNQAATRDRDDPVNPYLLGRVYLKNGDPNRARTALERCRDLDPDQVKCLRWLGTLLYRDQNYARAAELAQRAVDLGTTDAAAYLIAGLSYAFSNRCAEALPLLQHGMSITEEDSLLSDFQDGLRVCSSSGITIPAAEPTATPAP